jgi:hypothetical protein
MLDIWRIVVRLAPIDLVLSINGVIVLFSSVFSVIVLVMCYDAGKMQESSNPGLPISVPEFLVEKA